MHIGMIGLGKMGFNMRERLRRGGIEVSGFDRDVRVSDVQSVDELLAHVPAPRLIWVMVPAGGITDGVIKELGAKLGTDDLVIDGGNSRFTEDKKHSEFLASQGIRFVDCGVSGGIWGLENGYGLMAGGDAADIARCLPVFDALRPPGDRADSFVHVGGVGAGHYAKMVHNGIEYGLMQSYAEGYELLAAKDVVTDMQGTFRAWRKGTVVRSWLLDLVVKALDEDPELASVAAYVEDSGEGRWTVEEAVASSVPAPAITAALFARFASREDNSPSMKLVSALRNQFGGHATRPAP
ncbi:6-phosphogluconate dehydrogenase Gnd [Sinomonas cyclohexanicum]|uniref:6-phosphogluconate dehydrogenase Gnd n=1 Tax=Sinomonas cyclohexanicum TaxID=322009 RepID=A0ABM7Q146_SINCY|nr:decarboxylating 6-phosphogluconate dehydrogenase [Corynebacterium cyclohexanicum]BCT78220.1 6-phosphogluconate dehydrogenase Gnd [Corynebacterium cyclohexanicum]